MQSHHSGVVSVRHTAAVWIQLAPHLSDSQLVATEQLSTALVDSVSLHPSTLLMAARQQ